MSYRAFFEEHGIYLSPTSGAEIGSCIDDAIALAGDRLCKVAFVHNGTPVEVMPLSDRTVVYQTWAKARGY